MTGAWDRLVDVLDGIVAERTCAWGYQASVVEITTGTSLLSAAGGVDGLGRPLSPMTTSALYCSAKTLLAVALATLVEAGELSWDDVVGDIVEGCSPVVAATPVAALLTHRAGLDRPSLLEGSTLAGPARRAAALGQAGSVPPLGPDESLYTEAAGWMVLGAVAETLAGTDCSTLVRERVLDPLNLAAEFDLDAAEADRRRIAVSLRRRPMPLLLEQTEQFAFAANPGYGGFATMAGQAALHAELARGATSGSVALGVGPEVLGALVTPGPARWDRTFKRRCAFGLGVAAALGDGHGFGAVSPAAFGQAGLLGMSTVVADPELGFSAGVHLNGLLDAETSLGWLRAAVWDHVAAAAR